MSIANNINVDQLLGTGVTATGAGTALRGWGGRKTYSAAGYTTAGAGAATVTIEGSFDNVTWDVMGTITLTLSNTAADDANSDSFLSSDQYPFVRANVTALSGTGAYVRAARGRG